MFEWVNKQTVKSSLGFLVKSLDRDTILYSDDLKHIEIEVDVENGFSRSMKPCITIHAVSIASYARSHPLIEIDLENVLERIASALHFQGIDTIVKDLDGSFSAIRAVES